MAKRIDGFTKGEKFTDVSYARKLHALAAEVQSLRDLIGGEFIRVQAGPSGRTLSLNIDLLRQRLNIGTGTVTAGFVSAVSEVAGPPCDHRYKAVENAPGTRIIDDYTTPENARDVDVLYVAAGEGDSCLMWWDQDGTPHILLTTEIYDTVLDA